MQNIKELKRVLSNHYATGPAKLFFTPITSAVETGMQSQLLLKGWCESEFDFEKKD
jgi:hypothetical protein